MKNEDRILYSSSLPKLPRSHKKFWLFLLSFVTATIAGAAVYLLQSPNWRIREIEIAGLESLAPELIRNEIQANLSGEALFISNSSIFLARRRSLENSLRGKNPWLEEVMIEKVYPDKLKVFIRERKIWAMFCNDLVSATTSPSGPACVYLDKTGFAIEYAPQSLGTLIVKIRGDLPEIKSGVPLLEPDLAGQMDYLLQKLEKLGFKVAGFNHLIKIPSEIRAVTSQGVTIIFKREDNLDNVFKVLATVLEGEIGDKKSRLEYIDLRFGNKVFYKLK